MAEYLIQVAAGVTVMLLWRVLTPPCLAALVGRFRRRLVKLLAVARRTLKGRVFISHSSLDKKFVRRLDEALEQAGYKTWLDEKELRVGDQLGKEISTAIAQAGALIVVVSRNSVRSNWLVYEINLATERAIRGELRILPVLVETEKLPPELEGRLYADFRDSFGAGLTSVLDALKGDSRVARSRKPPAKPQSPWRSRTSEIEGVLHRVFDSHGSSSGGGDFKSVDYEFVSLARYPDLEIAVEILLDYGSRRPLGSQSLVEFIDVIGEYAVEGALLLTQRPIEFWDGSFALDESGKLGAKTIPQEHGWIVNDRALGDLRLVAVDLADGPDASQLEKRLRRARSMFE